MEPVISQEYLIKHADQEYKIAMHCLEEALVYKWAIPNLKQRKYFEDVIKGFITTAMSAPKEKALGIGLTVLSDVIWDSIENYFICRWYLLCAEHALEMHDFYSFCLLQKAQLKRGQDLGTEYFMEAVCQITLADVALGFLIPCDEVKAMSIYLKGFRSMIVDCFSNSKHLLSQIAYTYYENSGEALAEIIEEDAELGELITDCLYAAGVYLELCEEYYGIECEHNFADLDCSQRVTTKNATFDRLNRIVQKRWNRSLQPIFLQVP